MSNRSSSLILFGLLLLSTAAGANPISDENALAGHSWATERIQPGNFADGKEVEGFVSKTSVKPGDNLQFKINVVNDNTTVQLEIYRMGYYGGSGSRKAATLTAVVNHQPDCSISTVPTSTVSCSWSGISYTIPSTWVTGVYVVKMSVGAPSSLKMAYMIFSVRDESRTSKFLYQTADTTWQAYNGYGGCSFYQSCNGSSALPTQVSYDRPYAKRDDNLTGEVTVSGISGPDFGSGGFFAEEYGTVLFLEANGYDVSYASTIDIDAKGSGSQNLLLGRYGVVSGGHQEYWTNSILQSFRNARDAEVNFAFIGANQAYWEVGIDATERLISTDKNAAASGSCTGSYWQFACSSHRNYPEWLLLGTKAVPQLSQPNFYVAADFTIGTNPTGFPVTSNWSFDGTYSSGVQDGAILSGVVFGEINVLVTDPQGNSPVPHPSVLASYVVPPGSSVYDPNVTNARPECASNPNLEGCTGRLSSFYAPISGARVFTTGTFGWSNGLNPFNATTGAVRSRAITKNIFDNFSNESSLSKVIGLSGKFRGSGRSDMMGIADTGNGAVRVRLSAADLSVAGKIFNPEGLVGPVGSKITSSWASGPNAYSFSAIKSAAGDFNGDGRDDLAVFYKLTATTVKIDIFLSNADGTLTGSTWWPSATYNWDAIKVVAGDFNGDGRSDLCAFFDTGSGTIETHVFLSSGSSLTKYNWANGTGGYTWANAKVVAGDFDGDGKSDLGVLYKNSASAVATHVFVSSGASFSAQGWSNGTGGYSWDNVKLVAGDFNADGKADLGVLYKSGPASVATHVFVSSGAAFSAQNWINGTGSYLWENSQLVVGDYNGDGYADLGAYYQAGNIIRLQTFVNSHSSTFTSTNDVQYSP